MSRLALLGAGPTSGGAAAFDPSSISGLIGWWQADTIAQADGSNVNSWTDSSSGGHNLTPSGTTPTYQSGVVNGHAVVRFVSGVETSSTFAHPSQFSVFAVAKSTGGTLPEGIVNADAAAGANTRHFQFRYNTGTLEAIAFDTTPTAFTDSETATVTNFNYLSGVRAAATVQTWVNGTSGGSTATTGTNDTGTIALTIGCASGTGSNFFVGDIAEVLYYNSALNSTDRGNVENYLKTRYGL